MTPAAASRLAWSSLAATVALVIAGNALSLPGDTPIAEVALYDGPGWRSSRRLRQSAR